MYRLDSLLIQEKVNEEWRRSATYDGRDWYPYRCATECGQAAAGRGGSPKEEMIELGERATASAEGGRLGNGLGGEGDWRLMNCGNESEIRSPW